MGNGRYYTFEQFYSVIVLLALVIFIITSGIFCYLRTTNNDGKKYFSAIFTQLIIIAVARFVEEVIVSVDIAKNLRYSQNVVFLGLSAIFFYYFISKIIPMFESIENGGISKSKMDKYFLRGLFAILMGLLIYGVSIGESFIIKSYSFDNIIYTKEYAIIILICLLILFVICVQTLFIGSKSRIISMLVLVMCVVPYCVYFIFVKNNISNVDIIEVVLYFMFTIMVNILATSFIPGNIAPLAFDSIKDMILDYVFITDENGKIVYKNKNVSNTDFFNHWENIKLNNIKELFVGCVKERKSLNKSYVQLINNNSKYYFSYKYKILKNKNKVNCNIITITDITDLIEMLEDLEKTKKKHKKINEKLSDYSEKVYYMEKQKEINSLMEKIAKSQENSMLQIERKIDHAVSKIDHDTFENYIDDIILLSKNNLSEVRKAVSVYKEYYQD